MVVKLHCRRPICADSSNATMQLASRNLMRDMSLPITRSMPITFMRVMM